MPDETSTYPVDTDALHRRIEELQARLDETPAPAHGPGPGDGFYRRLIDLSLDAIFVHDKDHKIVFVNPAGVSQFSADSPDQVIGKDTTQFVHLDSREQVWARIRAVERQTLEPGITEQRRLRLDGTDYHAEVAAPAILWQGEAAALITVRDITERKLSEAALRENERRGDGEAAQHNADHGEIDEGDRGRGEGFVVAREPSAPGEPGQRAAA